MSAMGAMLATGGGILIGAGIGGFAGQKYAGSSASDAGMMIGGLVGGMLAAALTTEPSKQPGTVGDHPAPPLSNCVPDAEGFVFP